MEEPSLARQWAELLETAIHLDKVIVDPQMTKDVSLRHDVKKLCHNPEHRAVFYKWWEDSQSWFRIELLQMIVKEMPKYTRSILNELPRLPELLCSMCPETANIWKFASDPNNLFNMVNAIANTTSAYTYKEHDEFQVFVARMRAQGLVGPAAFELLQEFVDSTWNEPAIVDLHVLRNDWCRGYLSYHDQQRLLSNTTELRQLLGRIRQHFCTRIVSSVMRACFVAISYDQGNIGDNEEGRKPVIVVQKGNERGSQVKHQEGALGIPNNLQSVSVSFAEPKDAAGAGRIEHQKVNSDNSDELGAEQKASTSNPLSSSPNQLGPSNPLSPASLGTGGQHFQSVQLMQVTDLSLVGNWLRTAQSTLQISESWTGEFQFAQKTCMHVEAHLKYFMLEYAMESRSRVEEIPTDLFEYLISDIWCESESQKLSVINAFCKAKRMEPTPKMLSSVLYHAMRMCELEKISNGHPNINDALAFHALQLNPSAWSQERRGVFGFEADIPSRVGGTTSWLSDGIDFGGFRWLVQLFMQEDAAAFILRRDDAPTEYDGSPHHWKCATCNDPFKLASSSLPPCPSLSFALSNRDVAATFRFELAKPNSTDNGNGDPSLWEASEAKKHVFAPISSSAFGGVSRKYIADRDYLTKWSRKIRDPNSLAPSKVIGGNTLTRNEGMGERENNASAETNVNLRLRFRLHLILGKVSPVGEALCSCCQRAVQRSASYRCSACGREGPAYCSSKCASSDQPNHVNDCGGHE